MSAPQVAAPAGDTPGRARLAAFELLGAALLFSTGGAAIKATALTGWQVACFRSGVAALFLILVLRQPRRAYTPRVWLIGLVYAGTMICFVLSNKLTTSAAAIFLQSTAPLWVILLGPWLLSERLRRKDLPLIAALGVGLLLLFLGSRAPAVTAPRPLEGNIIALISGVFWAFTVCGLRGVAAAGGSTKATVTAGNIVAFFACLPMALPVTGWGLNETLGIGYLGIFQIGLAYVLVSSAIHHVSALEAALLLLLEPVLNPIWAWLVQGERPGALAVVGGTIILGATGAKALLRR